ncbi:hypothetical protein M3Y97_00184700 [Aphelenchoides bicaudatus]|nr:hypothetical protein M3Y97_00184700 [Aphelenchoides bicaudatus]
MTYIYCCCGLHVHVGTFIIGLICVLYSALSIFAGASVIYVSNGNSNVSDFSWPSFSQHFVNYAYYYTIGSMIENILLLLTSIILICGNRLRKPALYWPFIIYQILSLLISLARLIAVVYVLIKTMFDENEPVKTREQREQGILAISFLAFILILLFCFQFYFIWVVVRGRRFLVEERRIEKSVMNNYNPYHSGGTLVDPYYQYHRQWQHGHRPSSSPSYVYY